MLKLNLPDYDFRIKKENGKLKIFDSVRKAFVSLTPEEWVRQNFIQFLITEKNIPLSHIKIEKGLHVNKMLKRTDTIIYDISLKPAVLIEFKAPDVVLDNNVFEQINRYNTFLKIKYVVVSNGLKHHYFLIDYVKKETKILNDLPDYNNL